MKPCHAVAQTFVPLLAQLARPWGTSPCHWCPSTSCKTANCAYVIRKPPESTSWCRSLSCAACSLRPPEQLTVPEQLAVPEAPLLLQIVMC